MIFVKRERLERVKNIQLGQNNINVRKEKEKIDELKRFGIFISL